MAGDLEWGSNQWYTVFGGVHKLGMGLELLMRKIVLNHVKEDIHIFGASFGQMQVIPIPVFVET